MHSVAPIKTAPMASIRRGSEIRLHCARAWLSPVGAVAPEEVLSLDVQGYRTEETTESSHKIMQKSRYAGDAGEDGPPYSVKGHRINAVMAITSLSVRVSTEAEQVKPCEAECIEYVAFSPATFLKASVRKKFLRKIDLHVMPFDNSRWSGAEGNNGAQPNVSAWLWRNDDCRSALDHFWDHKSMIVANENLPCVRRNTNCHMTPYLDSNSPQDNEVFYA